MNPFLAAATVLMAGGAVYAAHGGDWKTATIYAVANGVLTFMER